MKALKSYYDVIGVAPHSSFEEIRSAYLTRSKMFHPDRFSRDTQKEEWSIANEMLQELNLAYNTLRDKDSRRLYDSKIGVNTSFENPSTPKKTADSSSNNYSTSTSFTRTTSSGFCYYSDLPESVRDRLLNRIQKKDKRQYLASLNSIVRNYVFLAFFLGWFILIFSLSPTGKWTSDSRTWIFWISNVAGVFIGLNLSWIIRWHKSPLGCHFIVTPIYFIHNYLDQIWYWPHYKLKSVRATHKYRNGNFVETDATFVFDTGIEDISFQRKEDYENVIATSKGFEMELQNATKAGDFSYESREDDFACYKNSGHSKPRSSPSSTTITCLIGSVGGAIVLSIIALSINSYSKDRDYPSRPSSYSRSPAGYFSEDAGNFPKNLVSGGNSISSTNSRPDVGRFFIFDEPLVDTPATGEVRRLNSETGIAPLEISSSSGADYVVKLTDADSGADALTIFVHGGQTEKVDVPLGKYIVKYASGEKWYGYKHLFGPSTHYSKADQTFTFSKSGYQVNGYSITLYKVKDGNLRTSQISSKDF